MHLARPLSTLVLVASALAQTHDRTPLVQGQPATLSLRGAESGELALFALSPLPPGPGPCLPPTFTTCLDLQAPLVVLPALPVSGGGEAHAIFTVPPGLPLVPITSQVVVARAAQPMLRKTNPVAGTVEGLSAFDDEFDGSALDPAWRVHNPNLAIVTVAGGELHVEPTQTGPSATWYADGEGPMVYRLVRGDFEVRARVRSYDRGDPRQPPNLEYDLGGIIVRDPASSPGNRDWVHLVVGAGTAAVPIAVEDKNTIDSNSDLRLTPVATPSAELRIVRQGAVVSLSYRPIGTAVWIALRSFQRPDLPPVVQVGLSSFSWSSPLRVRTSFDYVRFRAP